MGNRLDNWNFAYLANYLDVWFFWVLKYGTNAEMKGFSCLLQGHPRKSEIKLTNIWSSSEEF